MYKIHSTPQDRFLTYNDIAMILVINEQLTHQKFGKYTEQVKRLFKAKNGHLCNPINEYVELFNKCANTEMADGLYYYLTKIITNRYIPSFDEFLDDYIGYFKNDEELYRYYTKMTSIQISFCDFIESDIHHNFFGHCFFK